MFKTVRRIIRWCGEFRGKLYIGFVFSFFSTWFAAMPVMAAAYTVGLLIQGELERKWVARSLLIIAGLVLLRFLFSYLQARFQEGISYELAARDRLAIGEALKRVSLGYFQQVDTGNILNSVTTGLHTLENMGMRMVDTFIGGYLNFLVLFLWLLVISPQVSLIALAGAAASFLFLTMVSRHSADNAPISAQAERDLTAATLEYARGLPVVKSFGQGGASMDAMRRACRDNRDIRLKIEWGFIPANCLHLLALKAASVALAGAACLLGLTGELGLPVMLMFCFFSFSIFAGLEPISDSAHVLSVINNAMDQLDALREGHYIDQNGRDIPLERYDITFDHVDFGYEVNCPAGAREGGLGCDSRQVLKDVSFTIPQNTSTAIIGPSGSGKTTICNLIARFYDVQGGSVLVGGHDVRELTCDSLLKNISMVFQNVYLFHDTIRNNIRFGRPDATGEEIIAAAKAARCHDFIMALPDGYDTVVGEGGGTLSGGEKQRISIARAMLKDAPVIILDEATSYTDPENEAVIQSALARLIRGKTLLVIAHRLSTVADADRIFVVQDGRIAAQGTQAELLENCPLYREMWEAHMSVKDNDEGVA